MGFLVKLEDIKISKAQDIINIFDNHMINSVGVLNEGGYSKLMQTISGLIPSIRTFAVITWENPLSKKVSDEQNKGANKKLKDLLKSGNYSFRHIKGRYKDFENPFFINNISLDYAKRIGFEYGGKYKQDSILFGEKYEKDNKVGMNIKMIYFDSRKPLERNIWEYLDRETDAFYSEYKGRKFQIPFFDGKTKNKKFLNGKMVEDYNIFYAKDFDNKLIVKANREIEKMLDENENMSGKSKWINRGNLFIELKEQKQP